MESQCHLGKLAKYDTVTKRGWSVGVSSHAIKHIVEHLLDEDWDPENGISVPELEEETDCVVCYPFVLRSNKELIGVLGLFCLGIWGFQ